MKRLRKIIFWLHFTVGVTAGSVLAVMAFTGATMAFREQIVAWAERGIRNVTPPTPASRLTLAEITRAVREARPDARPIMIAVTRDPSAAVMVTVGRGDFVFVNPYTRDVRASDHVRLRAFFETMEHVHRWLGLQGEGRQVGLAVTSACCAALFVLLLSGLYLWWPRSWNPAALRAAIRFRFDRRGKLRDWNWHTTLGFWVSPILLLSTFTGLIMAYPRAGDLLYRRPPREEGGFAAGGSVRPTPGIRPLSLDLLLGKVEAAHPNWQTITLRLGMGRGPEGRSQVGAGASRERPLEGDGRREAGGRRERPAGGRMPVLFIVKETGVWPALPTQLSLDPTTGQVLTSENPSKYPFVRMIRMSARSFHIGEAGGLIGQALVMVGAISVLILIYTGFSLAVRRLFLRPRTVREEAVISAGLSAKLRTTNPASEAAD